MGRNRKEPTPHPELSLAIGTLKKLDQLESLCADMSATIQQMQYETAVVLKTSLLELPLRDLHQHRFISGGLKRFLEEKVGVQTIAELLTKPREEVFAIKGVYHQNKFDLEYFLEKYQIAW